MNPVRTKIGKLMRWHNCINSAMLVSFTSSTAAFSYPEYQQFVEKHSHRTVNCALCHVSEDGPSGSGKGQIGSLDAEQMKRLNQARSALSPGQEVDSPILNEFGNEIIKAVGKKKFVEMRSDPGKLADLLPAKGDLDGDGIPDRQEYLDGTDTLNRFHGDPWRLFLVNLSRYKMHIALAIVAVLSLNFGLVHLIKAISILQNGKSSRE